MTETKYTNRDWVRDNGVGDGVIAIGLIIFITLVGLDIAVLIGIQECWSKIEAIISLIFFGVMILFTICMTEQDFEESVKHLSEEPELGSVRKVKTSKLWFWFMISQIIFAVVSALTSLIKDTIKNWSNQEFQTNFAIGLKAGMVIIGIVAFIAVCVILFEKWIKKNHEKAMEIYKKKDDK